MKMSQHVDTVVGSTRSLVNTVVNEIIAAVEAIPQKGKSKEFRAGVRKAVETIRVRAREGERP